MEIENRQKKTDIGNFRAGDTIKVHQRIVEDAGKKEKKERIQIFEGVVISRSGSGLNEMVTVRKVVDGIGVEKTFPLHAKTVAKIDLVKYGKARRARLYYLRDLVGSRITRVKEDLQKNISAAVEKSRLRKEQEKIREQAAKEVKEAEAKAKEEAAKKSAEEVKAPEPVSPAAAIAAATAGAAAPAETPQV
jgi:large subunit ribosomal protein L19